MNVRPYVLPLCLALLPLLWLWPCVFGGRQFVPFDTAEFPPASLLLTNEQHAEVLVGANHDVTELAVWFVPELELARDELRAGRLPTWNPHARGGAPLHAHGLLGLCYPPNWLALCADDPTARLVLLAWISLATAGLSAFGLFRALGIGTGAAWFGAALFELATPLAANAFFWMRLASFVWLPALLWALLAFARHDTLRAGPCAAVAATFALPWLAGFPPFAATTTVLGGLFALWLAALRGRERGGRAAGLLLLRIGFAMALGALLALPQVLPSLLFFAESARPLSPSLTHIGLSRFDAYGLFGYLLPDLVGHPTSGAIPYGQSPLALWLCDRVDAAGKGALPNYNYTEYAVSLGAPGFVLAVLGALCGRGRHRAFALLAFALLLGLALFLPGVRLLYHLPLFVNVWPLRWLAPGTLLLAWLAALGLQRLQTDPGLGWRTAASCGVAAALVWWLATRPGAWHAADPTWWPAAIAARVGVGIQVVLDHVQAGAPPGLDRFAAAGERAATAGASAAAWLAATGALLLAFALPARERWRRVSLAALCALAVAQTAMHGRTLLHGVVPRHATETPVHEFLRARAASSADDGGFTIARASRGPMLQIQLPPGQLLAPGIRDLHFYTHFDARSLQPFARLLGDDLGRQHTAKGYLTTSLPSTAPGVVPGLLQHPYLDLCGVRYLLATEPLDGAGTRVGPALRGPRGEFFVFERPTALPRAFAVPELTVLPDDDAVLAALAAADLAPRRQVFVAATDAGLPAAKHGATPAGARPVRFVDDSPTRIDLEVGPGAEPWLVLADTFLPGWTATVDGSPAPVHRGNHWQRLVALPTTACRVVFSYAAPGLGAGCLAAGLGALALLLLALWQRRVAGARPAQDRTSPASK